MKPPRGVQHQRVSHRPADLAREHGISPQAVRNYERDGLLPAADRTPSGYRVYTATHAQALRTFLALVPAHGYPASRAVMRAVNDGNIDSALRTIDESHAGQLRDRATLDAVATAIGILSGPPNEDPLVDGAVWTIGELARRLGVTPATLRKWERTGILHPARDRFTGHRRYDLADLRDAELAHLLRRGGYLLADIAPVLAQVREAGGPEPLAESLAAWQQRLTNRSRAMLTAAGHLADYLQLLAVGTSQGQMAARLGG
jgi:DNA-binding transcriptional MerR regulator